MSKEIVALLEQNPQIQVEMTRTDAFISSEELYRPRFANELEADLFISIHGNSFDEASVSGTESFYYHDESQAFADIIHKHVVKATGFKDRGQAGKLFCAERDEYAWRSSRAGIFDKSVERRENVDPGIPAVCCHSYL